MVLAKFMKVLHALKAGVYTVYSLKSIHNALRTCVAVKTTSPHCELGTYHDMFVKKIVIKFILVRVRIRNSADRIKISLE